MGHAVHNAERDFWRSPTVVEAVVEAEAPPQIQFTTEACAECGSEFMIGARYCHTCGLRRPAPTETGNDAAVMAGTWMRSMAWTQVQADRLAARWRKTSFPAWMQYLHFHEIKRWVGLPTASLVAFMIGMGCMAGAIGVSLFYKASNLAEFQAIQMWRMEWLLAATASFVAGILLKKPSNPNRD